MPGHPFGSGVTVKIIQSTGAGLALAAVPAQAFVTYQDIVPVPPPIRMTCRAGTGHHFLVMWSQILTASSNTIIGNLFMVFNAIIATMGIVWFLFIGIRHVVRTGTPGRCL